MKFHISFINNDELVKVFHSNSENLETAIDQTLIKVIKAKVLR